MARPTRRPGNLPAEPTSFIGRRREIAELRKKLMTARLVSLVGPGGVGKTRLAIRAATDLGRGFAGGAWLVELAEIGDPALAANAVMAAIDLRDQAGAEPAQLLLAYLKDKEMLIVLDNCEHLVAAAAELVHAILAAAPAVRVIATSREPLSIPGEHLLPVPPLDLPAAHAAEPMHQLRQNEAVALFVERATAASGTFELTTSNQGAVADLCRQLDGLPLAIELAAVRMRVLSVEQILERLSDRFGLLTGGVRGALPRHQTLHTTIDWSYDLLSAEEQTLFRKLWVFAGRFTLEDVEALAADEVLQALSSLVDRSMVVRETVRAVSSFRLHETMRDYALLKLREAGEEEAAMERCTAYYVARCSRAMPAARYRLTEWLEWTELEIDNIRSVMRRCLNVGDTTRATDLVAALGWYWITRATTEGVRWLDEVLAAGVGNTVSGAWATFLRGFLAVLHADPPTARRWLARATAAAKELEDDSMLVQAAAMASIAARMDGDPAVAGWLLDEARAAVARVDDVAATTAVLQATAMNGMFDGDLETVRDAAAEGARISRDAGDLYVQGVMLMELAFAELMMGELVESRSLYTETLQIAQRIDDRLAQSYVLAAFAYFAAASGQARLCAQLLGAAEALRVALGASMIAPLGPLVAQAEETALSVLGQTRFAAEHAAGKGLSREEALRLALGERVQAPSAPADDARLDMLGKREMDVARLVAEGLTNKQIGARLFISERTVDSHVRNILNKLGFNSRAQIAAWIAESSR